MRRFQLLYAIALFSLSLYTSGCFLLAAGAVGGAAAGTAVSAKEGQQENHSAFTYVGTVLADVVYVPAKVVFAGLGAMTSGAAYLLTVGDSSVSGNIWDASVNGNYVLTPNMLEGKKPVHFVGP
ncbi:MAG: hypothetical protein ACHQ9S_17545 [Candidatus Binatia bacterium]